jgi:hypothetical protein
MSYAEALERLKRLLDRPGSALPKVPKTPSGTYGTPSPGTSENFRPSCIYGGCHSKALSEPPSSTTEISVTPVPGSAKCAESPQVLPLVRCRDCKNFEPDPMNPPAGIGRCRVDADGDRPPSPKAPRRCNSFEITRAGVFRIAQTACKGTNVDPSELTDWLIRQNDPDWLRPAPVRRWAECIEKRNGYPDGNPSKQNALESGLDGAKPEKEQKKHVFPY